MMFPLNYMKLFLFGYIRRSHNGIHLQQFIPGQIYWDFKEFFVSKRENREINPLFILIPIALAKDNPPHAFIEAYRFAGSIPSSKLRRRADGHR